MRLSHLAVLGLALSTTACGAGMEEKSATGGLGGVAAGTGSAGSGAATQKIEDHGAAQSGSGSTYSAPASRSSVTR